MMTKVGIDLRGGDHAPTAVLEGLRLAKTLLQDQTQIHLFGLSEDLHGLDHATWQLHECANFIAMDEHPVRALQSKPKSTMMAGFKALKTGAIDVLASAGHSGAMMVGAMQVLGLVEGISRPAVISVFPKLDGGKMVVLDVGINVDAKVEQFLEFARLGKAYAKSALSIADPKLYLLNSGAEASKGNLLYQKAHQLLAESDASFRGNMEPRDLFDHEADVLLCDGFTGNMLLKQTEAFYNLAQKRDVQDDFIGKLDYEKYGGSPILGVQGNLILAHGASGPEAIKNMILSAESFALANFVRQMNSI